MRRVAPRRRLRRDRRWTRAGQVTKANTLAEQAGVDSLKPGSCRSTCTFTLRLMEAKQVILKLFDVSRNLCHLIGIAPAGVQSAERRSGCAGLVLLFTKTLIEFGARS